MGLCDCTDRRTYVLFLSATVLQIILTIARWAIDFLGPLWSMILTDFLNIVFAILGFSGGYAHIRNYLFIYIIWSLLWIAWNIFIICIYIPIPSLEMYKSAVLSLGTGGFSYWETRAPGCVPDWASESKLIVTNCMFDPRLMEFIQAGLQVCLSVICIVSTFIILCKHDFDDSKSSKEGSSSKNNATPNTVPSFLSTGRSTLGSRMSGRTRASLGLTQGAAGVNANGDSSDQVTGNDDRLRPMTPRRVKRRSARSIQSQKFGPNDRRSHHHHNHQDPAHDNERPSTSRAASSNSARNSLRSNASSRRSHRSSKRKQNHQFISPVNRLMQQVDSETSHEEPGRYTYRDQGHVNPVYVGPQSLSSPSQPPPPPRPPSARSSYSNYHPARLPAGDAGSTLHPNVFNLNQNIFTNGGFDMSTEYNMSQNSNTTSANLYEEDINFLPDGGTGGGGGTQHGTMNTTTTMALSSPQASSTSSKVPNGFSFSFNPHLKNNSKINNNSINQLPQHNHIQQQQIRQENPSLSNNQAFAYPLAHSPVSQESFPMWGVSQPQSPVQNHTARIPPMQSPPYQNPPSFQPRPYTRQLQPHPTNSETVI